MIYELATKLKDAGFPQDGNDLFCNVCHEGILNENWDCINACSQKRDVHIVDPTLSELIEACEPEKADEFYLALSSFDWDAGYLYIGYFPGWPGIERDEDGFIQIELKIKGSTPEEAVANLWLTLNHK